jgi:hypothetical protein
MTDSTQTERRVPRTLAECDTIEAASNLARALTRAGFVPSMDMIDLLVSKTKRNKKLSNGGA